MKDTFVVCEIGLLELIVGVIFQSYGFCQLDGSSHFG